MQWAKYLALSPQHPGVSVVAQVHFLSWELPRAIGAAKERKKGRRRKKEEEDTLRAQAIRDEIRNARFGIWK